MILTLKMYDTTITWEEKRDDLTTDDMLNVFTKLMLAFGYHPTSIKSSVLDLAEEYKYESSDNK